ncbi:MAG: VOC family protein [Hyphomicrobiaceae bacterium]|nr:VOC family protein [Hyphomicrobiaceae bacterium]
MIPQRLSLITLGVADVARSRAFYEGLGWISAPFDSESVAFFDMHGVILSLFGREPLADDAHVPAAGSGFRAVAQAINLASRAEVDAVLAEVAAKGGRIVKPAQEVFWGGYSGYFADPDDHLWEVAHNPFWPLDEQGRPQLPGHTAP